MTQANGNHTVPLYGEVQGRDWATPQPSVEKAVFQFEIEPDHFQWVYTDQLTGAHVKLVMPGPPSEQEAYSFVRACQQLVERFKT